MNPHSAALSPCNARPGMLRRIAQGTPMNPHKTPPIPMGAGIAGRHAPGGLSDVSFDFGPPRH